MIFKPAQLGMAKLDPQELEADKKACRKIGPCGVGKKALYLNSFYIDRRYYLPYGSITRVFKRVAMSSGGFSGKGVFASMAYLVVEYDGGKQKQCNFKDERDVDALLEVLAKEQPQLGSYGVYFALFGFAAIFLFSSYNMLPTAHNNNNAIMKRADKAEAAMAEYVKHYPHGAFPVASWYAHPIVLKQMMDAVEEGRAVTVPEALDAVKARLKSLNADVQVEQEEYDEVVVIKALFLNHDYQ